MQRDDGAPYRIVLSVADLEVAALNRLRQGGAPRMAPLAPRRCIRRFWMSPIEPRPDEQVILQASAEHDHQWQTVSGLMCLTDHRLLFRGYRFPRSASPFGHRHEWNLIEIEAVGESRHAQTFFLVKHLYIQVQGQIHFFRVRNGREWLQRLADHEVPRA